MKKLEAAGMTVAVVLVLIAGVFFMEACSAMPDYRAELATVRWVEPDAKGLGGFPGESERTLVKFDDGATMYVGGRRGEPGERILVPRQRGVRTMFGILSTSKAQR